MLKSELADILRLILSCVFLYSLRLEVGKLVGVGTADGVEYVCGADVLQSRLRLPLLTPRTTPATCMHTT